MIHQSFFALVFCCACSVAASAHADFTIDNNNQVNHILPPPQIYNSNPPVVPPPQSYNTNVIEIPDNTEQPYVQEVAPAPQPAEASTAPSAQIFYPNPPVLQAAPQPPPAITAPPASTFIPQAPTAPTAQTFRPW